MSNVYTELRDARKRIAELETALREIYECMGGDDLASGWQDPNRVWGVARAALEAALASSDSARATNPRPGVGEG